VSRGKESRFLWPRSCTRLGMLRVGFFGGVIVLVELDNTLLYSVRIAVRMGRQSRNAERSGLLIDCTRL
jgi:hypothetical protein